MSLTKSRRLTASERGMMKAYAARDYSDENWRKVNFVDVNLPEYLPTVPQDNEYTEVVATKGYFRNENYPVTQEVIRSQHHYTLPIMEGTKAPTRMKKRTEFLLLFPTGIVEEGYLIYMRHIEDVEQIEEEDAHKYGTTG